MDSANLLVGSISSETAAPERLTRVGPMSTMAGLRGVPVTIARGEVACGRRSMFLPDRIPPKRPFSGPCIPCVDVRLMIGDGGKIPGGVNGRFVFNSAMRALSCTTLSWICF
jgi:hypothetical protein